MLTHVTHPFEPVVSPQSDTLILGSLPSVRSRAEGFYYGHPRNRFWQVLAAVYGDALPADIPGKRALILRHRLALWDVIASCDIAGSSDASVRNAVPVDIAQVTDAAPIARVFCNGALAGRLYARYLQPRLLLPATVLPSTSPANAAWSTERLTAAWQDALIGGEHEGRASYF